MQPGTRRMARAVIDRWRGGGLTNRCFPWTHLSHRYEPLRAHSAALAAHRFHRMDSWLWPGRLCVPAIPYRCDRITGGYLGFAASVSHLLQCVNSFVANTILCRMVAMMGFMMCLWLLVPRSTRRID